MDLFMDENLANDNLENQDLTKEISSNPEFNLEETKKAEQSIATTDSEEPTVNCLALTVQKDYKLSIAKNVFFKSIRSTFKIAFSVFALNLLKLFL